MFEIVFENELLPTQEYKNSPIPYGKRLRDYLLDIDHQIPDIIIHTGTPSPIAVLELDLDVPHSVTNSEQHNFIEISSFCYPVETGTRIEIISNSIKIELVISSLHTIQSAYTWAMIKALEIIENSETNQFIIPNLNLLSIK